jgi:hypothetical protein
LRPLSVLGSINPNACVERHPYDLPIAPHRRLAVCLAQDLSHFLQKLGLSVTRSLFKPVVHGSGQNRVLIEDAGPGMNLLQDLYMGMPPSMTRPLGVKPEGSKQRSARGARFLLGIPRRLLGIPRRIASIAPTGTLPVPFGLEPAP